MIHLTFGSSLKRLSVTKSLCDLQFGFATQNQYHSNHRNCLLPSVSSSLYYLHNPLQVRFVSHTKTNVANNTVPSAKDIQFMRVKTALLEYKAAYIVPKTDTFSRATHGMKLGIVLECIRNRDY